MRQPIVAAALCLSLTSSLHAKPSGSAPNPQIAYEALSGKSDKLIVSDENGTNASTLYSANSAFRFDLAPRSARQIAIVTGSTTDPALYLLAYTQTGTGAFAAAGAPVRLASARRGSNVAFSPDGTKIAFACCSSGGTEQLAVYDLNNRTVTMWGQETFYWDLSWFRGGASIAYSTSDSDGYDRLHEVTAPGQAPSTLFASRGDLYISDVHTNPNALVLDYNDSVGNARTGLWQDGSFTDANLANNSMSFFGELSCDDKELAYLGPPSNTPQWYIRDLRTGLTSLFSRSYYHWVQFWPTCS